MKLLLILTFIALFQMIKKRKAKAANTTQKAEVIKTPPPVVSTQHVVIEKDSSLDNEIKAFKLIKAESKNNKNKPESIFKKKNIINSFILSEVINKPAFKE